MIDEKPFRQCDPYRHDDEITNLKLGRVEIFGLLNRFSVIL